MADECRVYVVGDSLFTDTLAQMLAGTEWITIVGSGVSLDRATVAAASPDVVLLADAGKNVQAICGFLISNFPELPVICADLSRDYVLLITSQQIGAHREDLLEAIARFSRKRTAPR